MTSSNAILPEQKHTCKHEDIRQITLTSTLEPYLPKELTQLVRSYSSPYFTPCAVFQFAGQKKFIVITSPEQTETNSTDITKRITIHIVSPPDDIQALVIRNFIAADIRNFIFETTLDGIRELCFAGGSITFSDFPSHIHPFWLYKSDGVHTLLENGISMDVLDRLNIHYPENHDKKDTLLEETLIKAVKSNEAEEVRKLIVKQNANPNTIDKCGTPMLLLAVKRGYFNVVKALIENGADIESRGGENDNYRTALLLAVGFEGYIDEKFVTYLINQGANINAQDITGKTCLHYLMQSHNYHYSMYPYFPSVDFFLQHHADPCITSLSGLRPAEASSLYDSDNSCIRENFRLLTTYHMNRDAEKRVDHWSYCDGVYTIHFKQNLSDIDVFRGWEAIANKIKSQQVTSDLNLLSNDAHEHYSSSGGAFNLNDSNCCFMEDPTIYRKQAFHKAIINIPYCEQHAIKEIRGYKASMTITLADEYKYEPLVHKKLKDLFTELKLKQAPLTEDTKLSSNTATLFSPAGLDVANDVKIRFTPSEQVKSSNQ